MKIKAFVRFNRPECFHGSIEVPDDFQDWEWDAQMEWVEVYMMESGRAELSIDEFDYEAVE